MSAGHGILHECLVQSCLGVLYAGLLVQTSFADHIGESPLDWTKKMAPRLHEHILTASNPFEGLQRPHRLVNCRIVSKRQGVGKQHRTKIHLEEVLEAVLLDRNMPRARS